MVIYVDRGVADAVAVKKQVPSALVYQSGTLPGGKPITSHAKFVIIDHETILLTSANFSKSAEQKNIEFGLRIYDRNLATSIESTMSKKRGILYEEVQY